MRRVAQESGVVMMRTEKRGVGDSEGGPCSALDYRTELSDHVQALEALKSSEWVDPGKMVIFGASIGGTYAPLVAAHQEVAGIIVWGAGARNWFERMLVFERNFRELSGVSGDTLNDEMKSVAAFLFAYLVQKKSPLLIAAESPELGAVWSKIVGAEGNLLYGRPASFHQQAQDQNWTQAWNQVRSPVLVFYAEYDWYEDARSAELIARIVSQNRPGNGRVVVIPKTDHHFVVYSRPEDAVKGQNGRVDEGPVVREILSWLRERLGDREGESARITGPAPFAPLRGQRPALSALSQMKRPQ
jgi:pimeloyl-ACP methyl ester carboxylesterase